MFLSRPALYPLKGFRSLPVDAADFAAARDEAF
jgi:hypothetical protein